MRRSVVIVWRRAQRAARLARGPLLVAGLTMATLLGVTTGLRLRVAANAAAAVSGPGCGPLVVAIDDDVRVTDPALAGTVEVAVTTLAAALGRPIDLIDPQGLDAGLVLRKPSATTVVVLVHRGRPGGVEVKRVGGLVRSAVVTLDARAGTPASVLRHLVLAFGLEEVDRSGRLMTRDAKSRADTLTADDRLALTVVGATCSPEHTTDDPKESR